MSKQKLELPPCPFCKGGTSLIHENKGVWNGMKYGEPVSFEVRHWCEKQEGQPSPRLLVFVGKDRASAIKAWSIRASTTREASLQAEVERLRKALHKIVHDEDVWADDPEVSECEAIINVAKLALNQED